MKKIVFSLSMLICSCVFSSSDDLYLNNDVPPSELTIVSHLGAGFFAELGKVVDNILHFEKDNLQKINVDWSQEFFPYKDEPFTNGWDLYFDPIEVTPIPKKVEKERKNVSGVHYHCLHDFLCIDHWIHYEDNLPYRLNANRIINKYIKIKSHILEKVSGFYEKKMNGFYCVGVHIRYGADHGAEAPAGVPSLEDYIQEIKTILLGFDSNNVRIYIATDSHYVIDQFNKEFQEKVLCISAFRTEYRDEPHLIYGKADYWKENKIEWHSKKPGYYGGETVLLDCLFLSKCDVFVHSSSNVADFVTYFNPYIQSVYLPKNTLTWPCRHAK